EQKAIELCALVFSQQTDDINVVRALPDGRSNVLFVMACNAQHYTVRLPGEESHHFIDRKHESIALEAAISLNITPKLYYFNKTSGLKIADYIPGHTLNKNVTDEELKQLANVLHQLHQINDVNISPFEPQTTFDRLLKEYNQFQQTDTWPTTFFKRLMTNNPKIKHKTLIHGDINPANILIDTKNKLWLLDFEYAKVYDPLYDIACMGSINMTVAKKLLLLYFGHPPTQEELTKLYYYRILQTILWYLTAKIKHHLNVGILFTIDFGLIAKNFKQETENLWAEYMKIIKG
ncbi:MAG: phosphotransferase family protein, partial [Candidatus Izimaplasma sp.]|nr:phosphotransferase family protein [Candidatus Izimaplasma bacterium]